MSGVVTGLKSGLKEHWLSLIMMAGLGITTAATAMVGSREIGNHRLQFQQQIATLTTALERNLTRYTEVLMGMGDFFQVSNLRVSPDQFGQFVARALAIYPGIQALEWAPYVPESTRTVFEQEIRNLGIPSFRITETTEQGSLIPAGSRAYYVPVTYVEPLAGNEVAVGFDLASNQTRRVALETARQTRQVVASGRIRLVQETADQFGFLMFLPLFKAESQRDIFQGYLLGVFRVGDVIQEALNELSPQIDFDLYDLAADPDQAFLGHYNASAQTVKVDSEKRYPQVWNQWYLCPRSCTQTLAIGGREWQLRFRPPAGVWRLPTATLATAVLGLALTLLMAAYLNRSQAELLQARELSDLKQRLFAMASHELRTPLSTILISAQSLESHGSELLSVQQRAKIYSRIRSSSKRMTQLLNDLLTLNRAEAGKLTLTPELVNLAERCQQWIEDIKACSEDPHDVELSLDPNCQRVFVDPKLVQPIVVNLVSNAFKYSPEKTTVYLKLAQHSQFILIQVRDRGIGIPEQDQERLFEGFFRGSNVGDIPGTGLGLAVVQTCVSLHQGTLAFESAVGVGSTFTVVLPRID